MQLYLDCSGVLADHTAAATDWLGMSPHAFAEKFGRPAFWDRIAQHPDFYASLPLLPDALDLFEAVRHLDPVILTGHPRGEWAGPQKARWVARHFPGTRIITCLASEKWLFAREGDILVEDMPTYRRLWQAAGGIFVQHRSARQSIRQLREIAPEAFA